MSWFLCLIVVLVIWLMMPKKKKKHKGSALRKHLDSTPLHDDNLATIVISSRIAQKEQISKKNNSVPGKWINQGDPIEIYGRKITRGFFYYGGILKSDSNFYSEPSLVDPLLEVSNSTNKSGENIGYWPSYERISSGERGTYLDWLASDRDSTLFGLSYAFIYFYGLERRIVIDSQQELVTNIEFKEIFNEVKRLNFLYHHNGSFNSYSANLMGTMYLLRPDIISLEELQVVEFNAFLFKIKLSDYVSRGKAIPSDITYDWLTKFSEYRLLTPAQRCNVEFKDLFKIEFSKKFPNGFLVKPNKTALKLDNRFASMGLVGSNIEIDFLPDVTALISPIKNQLVPIADSCTEKLNAYSRYLGKEGNSRDDLNSLMLLPPELLQNSNNQITELKEKIEVGMQSAGGIIAVDDLWSLFGLERPERINKKEIELLQNVSQIIGYAYAPDERYHGVRIKPNENIVLYKVKTTEKLIPSMFFHEITLSLRLGALVALIDDQLDTSEVDYLESLIVDNKNFSDTEKASLKAYLKWCLNNKPNLAGLKARIEKLDEKEIEAVRSLIINVVLADGESSPEEIKQVEKIYRSLSLDPALAIKDIHELSTSHAHRKISRDIVSSGAMIDYSVLAQHKEETKHVQSMLQEIFAGEVEHEDEPLADVKHTIIEEAEPFFNKEQDNETGLDTIHLSIYQRLVSKEVWYKDEMVALSEEFNIMINGAIETINDWAFELIDAPIIEGNGPYYVDLEIVEEIEEERGKI